MKSFFFKSLKLKLKIFFYFFCLKKFIWFLNFKFLKFSLQPHFFSNLFNLRKIENCLQHLLEEGANVVFTPSHVTRIKCHPKPLESLAHGVSIRVYCQHKQSATKAIIRSPRSVFRSVFHWIFEIFQLSLDLRWVCGNASTISHGPETVPPDTPNALNPSNAGLFLPNRNSPIL